MDYIVTHPGLAHRDEFLGLSLCLAKSPWGATTPIFRREPTAEELENTNVLVVDVGRKHEPEKGNFDHHQFGRDEAPRCALSLLDAHYQWGLSGEPWFEATAIRDVRGPGAMAKHCFGSEVSRWPGSADSPVERACLNLFGASTEVPEGVRVMMRAIGEAIFSEKAKADAEKIELVEKAEMMRIYGGVKALVIHASTAPMGPAALHCRKAVQELDGWDGELAAIAIVHNNRGQGWSLYRYFDHPMVDFSRLSGQEGIEFAHPGGFLAVTESKTGPCGEMSYLALLCRRAIVLDD